MYHALLLNNNAVIRKATDGITDFEFDLGVRHSSLIETSMDKVVEMLLNQDIDILSKEEWNIFIGLEEFVPSNSFSKPIVDKWDSRRTIY
jgi:hypothetical protein